jgi:hypothetical protein
LRADRHAVEADDVRRLAVDLDRVGQVVLVRRGVGDVVRPDRRAHARQHQQDEQQPEEDRHLVAAKAPEPEFPRPHPVDAVAFRLLLPGRRALEGSGFG